MADRDREEAKVEGELAKRFSVFNSDIDGRPHERLAEFDKPEEVIAFCRRLDVRYQIRTAPGKYLNKRDFEKQFGPSKKC